MEIPKYHIPLFRVSQPFCSFLFPPLIYEVFPAFQKVVHIFIPPMSNMRYDSPFSDDEIFSPPLIWTYCILFCFYSLLLHLPTKNDTSSSPNRSSNHLGTISKTTLCQKDYYHSAATTISTKSKRNGPNSTGKRRRTASDTLNTHITRLTNGTNSCSATPPGASASLPLRCATIW